MGRMKGNPKNMKKLLHDLRLILVLGLLWAGSGYFIGTAFVACGLESYPLGIMVASGNLIIGMLWLKGIISDPLGDRLFFEGPGPDEDGNFRIGCLWVMPVMFSFIGLLLWFWAIVFRILIDK